MVKVTYAQLHDVLFVPSLGQLDAKLITTGTQGKTIPGFEMFRLTDGDLYIKWKSGHAIVPSATIKLMTLDPEAKLK